MGAGKLSFRGVDEAGEPLTPLDRLLEQCGGAAAASTAS
jgi:hypothetical protein